MSDSSSQKQFRCNAKEFSITYPQCSVGKQALFDWFCSSFHPRYCCVARELHADGTPHLHVCAVFSSRKDVKNEKFFDYKDGDRIYHPNIQKSKRVHWWDEYIKKGGDYVQSEGEVEKFNVMLYEPGKRKKTYEDIKWSNQYVLMSQLKSIVYPLNIGKGIHVEKPDPSVKRRNLWIVSAPDAGKTYWISSALNGLAVYYVTPSKQQYWFESYNDEDIIVCDDVLIPFSAIANILNTHLHPGIHVAGAVRFTSKFWKYGHTRTMIVLSNQRIQNKYGALSNAMLARFREIDFASGSELVPTSVVHVSGCTSNPCTCAFVENKNDN